MTATFETALAARVEAMADACTRCGKCVEVCPVTGPGGVNAEPVAVISGIIDILRTGDGPEASRKWANACVLSGECIKACDYGVNPRFMLGMARVAMARHKDEPPQRRRQGVDGFRKVARDVSHISQMQLDDELLTRLGQKPGGNRRARDAARLRVLHRLQRAQDPAHCAPCARHHGYARRHLSGAGRPEPLLRRRADAHRRRRDIGAFRREHHGQACAQQVGQVVSWCPSCHVQFTETTLPTVEKTRGSKPFEMTPFMLFLRGNLDRLRPFLRKPVPMRIALHRHPGLKGVVEAAEDILHAVPGVELVDLKQPAVGMMSNYFRALPAYRRELQKNELDAAERAGVDALVAVYHADHRELCAHERDYPFRIMNLLEIVGASMGFTATITSSASRCCRTSTRSRPTARIWLRSTVLIRTTRQAIQAMLDEQPLPLRGASL